MKGRINGPGSIRQNQAFDPELLSKEPDTCGHFSGGNPFVQMAPPLSDDDFSA